MSAEAKDIQWYGRLTDAQRTWLGRADARGLIECNLTRGLQRANWNKMMRRMEQSGFVREYVHGGYEITDLGRAALNA